MSVPMGMVMVLAEGVTSHSQQETVIARAMNLSPPLPRHSHDSTVLSVGGWLPDGTLIMRRNPMGFELLIARWSPNVLCQSDARADTIMDMVEQLAIAAVDELGVRFGYLSHYSNHLEKDWIEQQALVPLLCEDWNDLVSPLYHLVMHAADIPLPCPASATVLHESRAGRIIRIGQHRSPFGNIDNNG
jgi:hypothetical protein